MIRILLVGFLIGATQSGNGPSPDPNATLVYIGTHTSQSSQAKGIYLYRLQPEGTEVFQNVTLVPLGLAAETPNPTAMEIDVKRRVLFTVNDIDRFEGQRSGAVSAYAIDGSGKLTLLNQRPSMGAHPCHLTLDKDARNLLVANCATGNVVVLPIAPDGRLAPAAAVADAGPAAAPCVAIAPDSRFVFLCHPTSDRVVAFAFDADTSKLTPAPHGFVALKPGASPRHLLFRPDGRFAYVLNEKHSTIGVFAYDAPTGKLTEVQTVSTVPEWYDGPNAAWELGMHRSGKWLYVSNAGHNSLVQFSVDAEKGTLTYVEEQGTGGRNPRHFGIEPSSKHLAISNVDSNTVLASRIDGGNGRLKPSGIFADLPAPACIRFLPPPEK